jgi:predicted RNase H-like HicB family nuclease
MLKTYTAKYTRIPSGYMGQLIEWPEVITEGKTLDSCRELLQDALREMIAAYREQDMEMPLALLSGPITSQIRVRRRE